MKGLSPNIVIFFEISLIAPLRSVSNYNAGACSALSIVSMLWPRRCCVHESRARAAPWRAAAWRRDVTQQQPRQSGHRHGTELVPRRHYDVMQISDTSDTDTSVHYYDTLPPPPPLVWRGPGWRGGDGKAGVVLSAAAWRVSACAWHAAAAARGSIAECWVSGV